MCVHLYVHPAVHQKPHLHSVDEETKALGGSSNLPYIFSFVCEKREILCGLTLVQPKESHLGTTASKKKKKSLWIHKIMITYPTNKQLLSTFYVAGSMLFSPDRCASCPSRIYMDIGRVGFRSMSGTKENQGIDCTTDLFRGLLLT